MRGGRCTRSAASPSTARGLRRQIAGDGSGGGADAPAAEGGGGRGPAPAVAGVLYKWTNFGKGWRRRLFLLRGGVLTYYKLRRPAAQPLAAGEDGGGVRVIGAASAWVSGAPATRIKSRSASCTSRSHHFARVNQMTDGSI
uniref:PH domain-containing protein n=1 Tax=Ananas comosus var. bracteatus TaxID=296719 RepID=A0A6V7PWM0_ANACO|nr:unnamed protein product [Ananas comosus var. bracteatus]